MSIENLPLSVQAAMVEAGWSEGEIRGSSKAAARMGNAIHSAYEDVQKELANVLRTSAKLQEALSQGQSAYDVMWVNQASSKLAEAAAKLETLMSVAQPILTQEQVVVAHSDADVYFTTAK